MRRYTPLLLTAFLMVLFSLSVSLYMSGHADKPKEGKPLATLTVYTTLPAESAGVLAKAYEDEHKVRVDFLPLPAAEVLARAKGGQGADLLLADQNTLEKAAQAGDFADYASEAADSVSPTFKNKDGLWTGIWYDPVVFVMNRDYLRATPRAPSTWSELAAAPEGTRIALTDFLATDAFSHLFFSMMSQFGDTATYNILRGIQPKVVQYARYLSTPVRMAGMGEVDLSVAVESEALRYLQQGYPLQIVYPADGTAYTLTGCGILKETQNQAAAQSFADWLLSDEAQLALQGQDFYFVPTNPATLAYKSFAGKNIVLFSHEQPFTDVQRHELLDRWVKEIRFQ